MVHGEVLKRHARYGGRMGTKAPAEGNYEQYQNLCNAVVKLAAQDYARELRKLRKHPESMEAKHEVRALESFFCSQRFALFSDLDGPSLMHGIERMTREKATGERAGGTNR